MKRPDQGQVTLSSAGVPEFWRSGVSSPTSQMKHSKAIGFAAAVLFAALWAIPLARAVAFFRWAQGYFSETSSINASNDLHFSFCLLDCYLVSLLEAFAF